MFVKVNFETTEPPKKTFYESVWTHELATVDIICDILPCHFIAEACERYFCLPHK